MVARDWTLAARGRLGSARRRRRSGAGGSLRIVAHVEHYLPTHAGGAQRSLHTTLRFLADGGAEVRVLKAGDAAVADLDGIVVAGEQALDVADVYSWADVAFTQLAFRGKAQRLSADHGIPLVYFARASFVTTPRRDADFGSVGPVDLFVFNSCEAAARYRGPLKTFALPPPVPPGDYRTTPGDAITLVNLSETKGAATLYALADRMPNHQFLAVRGSHGAQVDSPTGLANLTILEHTADIVSVYSRTRILLVPSARESYGRVGLEAAASGIPTIAHPSDGPLEALADAALYAHRDDTDAWCRLIRLLDDPVAYDARGARAHQRSTAMDPTPTLQRFEATLQSLLR